MVAITVRRGSESATIHASTVGELYTNTARHFNISDELTLRLVFRARVLQRTDNFSDRSITDGSVVVMTVGNNTPAAPYGTNNTETQNPPEVTRIYIHGAEINNNSLQSLIQGVTSSLSAAFNAAGGMSGNTATPSANFTSVPFNIPEAAPPPLDTNSTTQPPVEGVPLGGSTHPSEPVPIVFPVLPRHQVPIQQPSMPSVAGVYLHLHVNMNELDAVPERLVQFQQRIAQSASSSLPNRFTGPSNRVHLAFPRSGFASSASTNAERSFPASQAPQSAGNGLPSSLDSESPARRRSPPSSSPPSTKEKRETKYSKEAIPPTSSIWGAVNQSFLRLSSLERNNHRLPFVMLMKDWPSLWFFREALLEEWETFMKSEGRLLLHSFIMENRSAFGLHEDNQFDFVINEVVVPWVKELDENLKDVMSSQDTEASHSQFIERLTSLLERFAGGTLHFLSQLPCSSPLEEILKTFITRDPNVPMLISLLVPGCTHDRILSLISSYRSTYQRESDVVLLLLPVQASKKEGPVTLDEDVYSSLNDLADEILFSDESEQDACEEGNEEVHDLPQIPEVDAWVADTGNVDTANSLRQILAAETSVNGMVDDALETFSEFFR